MTKSIYILGAPGSGKSTAMASLIADWEPGPYTRLTDREMFGHPLDHPILGEGLYLGNLRKQFPGTDALSMSVQPQALLWLERGLSPSLAMVFGEGARLGNPKFLQALGRSTRLTVVYLSGDPEVLAERRASRPDVGSWKTGRRGAQSEAYARSQATRALNAASEVEGAVWIDTTSLTPQQVLEEILCSVE